MDVKNPFLFAEEEVSPNSQNSNPFLMNEDDFGGGNDNPFLSQNATTMSSGGSTNPFAFDPMDLGPAEAQPPELDFKGFDVNAFGASNPEAIFCTTQEDFLADTSITITSTAPQKPTDLDLKYTNSSDQNIFDVPPKPPKETQDLLMSVMGAMDATSSHLLDRIPPTRTPSPVSMRDLHSPSPTPEPFGDLLDVSDSRVEEPQKPDDADFLMLDQAPECDVNKNHAPPKPTPPQRPSPPARPPRPALPPQKPPPPNFAQPNQIISSMPPQLPPQPVPQIPPQKPPLPAFVPKSDPQDDFMFGDIPSNVPPKPVTATDIMSLYNTPAKKPEVSDLLCDTFDAKPEETSTVPPPDIQETNVFENHNENVPNDKTPQPIVQDNFISPEPSDLQMDTSDSQSKGSVSSVTFNPFAAPDEAVISPAKPNDVFSPPQPISDNVFQDEAPMDVFTAPTTYVQPPLQDIFPKQDDAFDAFSAKFESAAQDENKNGAFDAFGASTGGTWGESTGGLNDGSSGFGQEESFDAFLAMREPPAVPQSTPNRFEKSGSLDSDEGKDFSVVIRPLSDNTFSGEVLPTIAPPPTAQAVDSSRFNPFDQSEQVFAAVPPEPIKLDFEDSTIKRTDSQETPPTPLFDDDVSQPLENFPRVLYLGEGWEMQLRQPNKKKITGQRFWKKIFVRIVVQNDCTLLQLFNQQTDKDPFQELPLQPCYSVSEIGAQQYDNFGKIFTVKLQYIFYKERPGVRPGQVKKAERITNKLSQFAAYAMQGDYQGVKEFGSDLKKLGLPVEHAPQVSQLMKLGSLNYEDLKQFSVCIEEALFALQAHRDRALHYKMEEVQITAVDELYVEQDAEGHVEKQIARVRLFFLGFLTGMPDVELGINDMRRQGKEVVGRHDIIPVVTEEWIRLENVEFHSCVQQDEYEKTHIIRFKPPDACYIELMRFRIRPPRNRELPLQLKPTICITGNKIELRADVLVPGFASRKLGQVPCEDVMIRFPIPECWIYLFRVEKHFRYGSVKSAHRRTGKIKGIERILGTMDTLQESLIEVTSGQAKYEHQHRAIVWRCPRLPKEGQGAYTTHNMVCRMALTSYDQMPEQLAEYCYVEFTMPATQASHTTVRSVSLQNSDSDDPPEKYVRYLARHEYRVGIEHTEGAGPAAYEVATSVSKPVAVPVAVPEAVPEAPESSSDSD